MRLLIAILVLIGGVCSVVAQGVQFFQISGPAPTTIIAFNFDGTMVWSNAQPGTNYIVQTCTSLIGGTNWVNYVQIPVTNAVNTNLLVAFNPPSGMSLIPAGVFTIGDTLDGEGDAIPTNVYVSAFYMGKNLVSYSQWQSVFNWATNNGYVFDHTGAGKAANHPVQTVNWYDCVKWCNARSQLEGSVPVYYTDAGFTKIYTNGDAATIYPDWAAVGYRLPTEAEWEKAARGGLIGQRFPWGDTISESQANYEGNSFFAYDLGPNGYNTAFTNGVTPYTSPVGYFAANGYGIYDMAGNLGQWCWDWYQAPPYPTGSPYLGGSDPHGPASSPNGYRMIRGGVWGFYASGARCANRGGGGGGPPSFGNFDIGFRCVLGL